MTSELLSRATQRVEDAGELLMRFTAAASPEVIDFVRARLAEHGVIVAREERRPVKLGAEKVIVCLALTTTQSVLESEAEHHAYVKHTVDGIVDAFSVAARDNFVGIDRNDFFTLSERAQLLLERLDFIRVVGDSAADFSRQLDDLGVAHDHGGDATLRHVLESNNLVDVVTPLHDPAEREALMWQTMNAACTRAGGSLFSPIERLRAYYGPEVAMYFSWVDFITAWLFLPAAAGVVLFVARSYNGDTIDTCELTPYCACVCVRLFVALDECAALLDVVHGGGCADQAGCGDRHLAANHIARVFVFAVC